MTSGLVIERLSKRFGDLLVLDDINLEVAAHELLVLLGPSGCGKSTLLRIISGLEEADSGKIYIGGKRVDQLTPRQRNVSLVFQNYSLYPHMTVAKNLAFPLSVAGVKSDVIKQRVAETAKLIGLSDRLSTKPGQLSGGQRQRVALGRAIIKEPSIFLLDEPLSNLDADLRLRMRQEIVGLQRRLKTTMVHVTHDQIEALSMADKIALLNAGRLEQIGTPEELYKSPANIFVAKFLGQPTINIVNGQIIESRILPFGLPANGTSGSGPVLIGVRPESLQIMPNGELAGEVIDYEYLGDHYTIVLKFRDLQLTASSVYTTPPPKGQTVRFSIKGSDLLLFSESGQRLA